MNRCQKRNWKRCSRRYAKHIYSICKLEAFSNEDCLVPQPGEPEIRGGASGDPERAVQVDQRVVLTNHG